MQTTETRTIDTIWALRAIADHSFYNTEARTPVRTPATPKAEEVKEQARIWARRAADSNGFGGM